MNSGWLRSTHALMDMPCPYDMIRDPKSKLSIRSGVRGYVHQSRAKNMQKERQKQPSGNMVTSIFLWAGFSQNNPICQEAPVAAVLRTFAQHDVQDLLVHPEFCSCFSNLDSASPLLTWGQAVMLKSPPGAIPEEFTAGINGSALHQLRSLRRSRFPSCGIQTSSGVLHQLL